MIKARSIYFAFQDLSSMYQSLHLVYFHLNIGPRQDNRPQPASRHLVRNYDDEIILYWTQRKYKRTIRLNPYQTNTGTLQSAPGYSRFIAFSSNLGELDDAILDYAGPLGSNDEQDSY